MAYLYETHLHTCLGSACGRSTGAEHARHYKQLGYQGIIITDHFFGGNTAVPRHLPWEKRIELFCRGYEDAKAEGDRIGLDVFFGWEQNFRGDEYLIYGLDKEFLLAHPEMERWSRREQLEEVHRYGGCVVQAHPFRDRDYIPRILLAVQYADGIEAGNGGNPAFSDVAAWRYAQEFELPMTAGSDNHLVSWAQEHPDRVFGVALDKPLGSMQEFAAMIRSRAPIGLHVPPDRFDQPEESPVLTTYWLDELEQPIPTLRDWLNA